MHQLASSLLCRRQLWAKTGASALAFILGFSIALLYLQSLDHYDPNRITLRSRGGRKSALESPEGSFLIVIIFTAAKNAARRTTIRETWLKFGGDNHRRVKYYFVVGTAALGVDEEEALNVEHAKHGDLLLLPTLRDQYERLTAKLMQTLKWVAKLHQFDYILKVDDDSFVRLGSLYDEMVEKDRGYPEAQRLLYWGYFDGRAHVKRAGPWQESDWFLCDRYLPYALGGGYVLSRRLVDYVVQNADLLQHYKSEDVSLGVWLAPLKINRIHDTRFDTEYQSRGCMDSYLIQHKQPPLEMKSKFASLSTQERLCASGEIERKLAYEYNWKVPPSKCCARNVTMTSR